MFGLSARRPIVVHARRVKIKTCGRIWSWNSVAQLLPDAVIAQRLAGGVHGSTDQYIGEGLVMRASECQALSAR